MSVSHNSKLSFIHSLQFLSSSLHGLVKTLDKDDFEYLRQEIDNKVLDSVKQKRFYPYEYMSNFKKFKEQLPTKKEFYRSLSRQNK